MQEVSEMCKKYVILAVCAALVVTLIHAPDSCGKTRATKYFDSKVWVRIDEVEGHDWNEIAAYPRNGERGNQYIVAILVPYFNFSFLINTIDGAKTKYDKKLHVNGVGVIEHIYNNKWRPKIHR